MPEFKYTAVDAEGVISGNTVVAENEEEIELMLKKEGLSLINLRLIPEAKETLVDQLFHKTTDTDKAQFLEYFASMLEAGLTVMDVLQAFYEDLDKPKLRQFVKDTQYNIRNGKKLSECFAQYPELFPQLYVGMIKVGEASGTLAQSLRHLANQLKKNNEIKSKVRGAMIYPTILIVAVVAVVTLLLLVVFPKLEEFFADASLELPVFTLALIDLSKTIRTYWYVVVTLIVGGIIGFRRGKKIPAFRHFLGRVALKLPIFGRINKTRNVAVFARTFGSLLSSGVNILEAIDVVQASLSNEVYIQILDVIREDMSKGNALADSMKKFPDYFAPFEIRVLSISERTGEVADGLHGIAEFYETRLYNLLGSISTAIEPILLLGMGGIVVIVALSVITPIYQLLAGIEGV